MLRHLHLPSHTCCCCCCCLLLCIRFRSCINKLESSPLSQFLLQFAGGTNSSDVLIAFLQCWLVGWLVGWLFTHETENPQTKTTTTTTTYKIAETAEKIIIKSANKSIFRLQLLYWLKIYTNVQSNKTASCQRQFSKAEEYEYRS